MSALRNRSVLVLCLIAALAVLIGGSVLPSSAAPSSSSSAYPPTTGRTLSASTTTPTVGGHETISGTGWEPGILITITIHSKAMVVGTTRTNSKGSFSLTVTIPTCLSGHHTLIASSPAGIFLSFPIFVTGHATTTCNAAPASAAAATPGSGSSSGGLPFTGVDVYALGGLSGLLMMAGGILLLTGRRRRPITA